MTYSELILSHSPSNYWKLNEPSGTVAADSAGSAPGTISGGVTLAQPGALADGTTAMTFDGSTGKITTSVLAALGTNPVTLECWIKWSASTGDTMYVVDNKVASTGSAGLQMFVDTISVYFGIGNGSAASSVFSGGPSWMNNVWHHAVGVLERGATDYLRIYVDGVLRNSLAVPAAGWNISAVSPLVIGTFTGDAASSLNHFLGAIDEVAIYPRALTPTEISDHYAARLTTAVPSAGCDHTTVWSKHLATLSAPTVESERAYLATLYGVPGGSDMSTLVSRYLQAITCGATSLDATLTPETVQTGTASAASADTLTLTFPGATGNGRGIVVGVISSSTSALPAGACSDNKGNAYTRILSQIGTANSLAVYLCPKGVGGPVHTITIAPALGAIDLIASAIEVHGVGAGLALDASGSTSGSSATPATTSSAVSTPGLVSLALMAMNTAQTSLLVSTTDGQTPPWVELAEDLV